VPSKNFFILILQFGRRRGLGGFQFVGDYIPMNRRHVSHQKTTAAVELR
jgi:hypothetical protein